LPEAVRHPQTARMIDQMRDESLTLPRPQVLILGASTRAAAMSALRAGFDPVCIDQFADADLRQISSVTEVDSLSLSSNKPLKAALKETQHLPVIPVGGTENQLDLLRELASLPTGYWGATPAAVARVRDPFLLAEGLEELKQRVLAVQPCVDPPPRDGQWVVKPLASAGGRNIAIWDEAASVPQFAHFFQQRVTGNVYSGLFLAETEPGDVRFVGLTRQLVGCPELDASPFAWCGNIGPVFLPVETEFLVRRWGNILKWKFGLTGLFGIDFMVDEAGAPWLLEVNPRVTGSVEILELACATSLLADHVACYAPEAAAQAWEFAAPPYMPGGDRLGRAILYAPRQLISHIPLPDPVEWESAPRIADIPNPGSVIAAGQPVCSVYAWGENEAEVTSRLFALAAEVQGLLR
jgi:predicted ATP-grasp superfamily ATP-dependent carboligase